MQESPKAALGLQLHPHHSPATCPVPLTPPSAKSRAKEGASGCSWKPSRGRGGHPARSLRQLPSPEDRLRADSWERLGIGQERMFPTRKRMLRGASVRYQELRGNTQHPGLHRPTCEIVARGFGKYYEEIDERCHYQDTWMTSVPNGNNSFLATKTPQASVLNELGCDSTLGVGGDQPCGSRDLRLERGEPSEAVRLSEIKHKGAKAVSLFFSVTSRRVVTSNPNHVGGLPPSSLWGSSKFQGQGEGGGKAMLPRLWKKGVSVMSPSRTDISS